VRSKRGLASKIAEKAPGWFTKILMPELVEIKGELKNINMRIDALDSKVDSVRNELKADISRAESKIEDLDKRLTAQITEVDERLSSKLDSDQKLSAKVDDVDKRLSGKIDAVDEKLTGKIDGIDQRLTNKIDDLDKRLDIVQRLSVLEAKVAEQRK